MNLRAALFSLVCVLLLSLPGWAQSPVNVAGASNIAVGGFDAVSLFEGKKPLDGDPSLRVQHDGATYLFANQANKAAFEKSPEKYAPQFGGYCAFGVSLGVLLPVDIDTAVVVDGKLYLNLNPQIAKEFAKDTKGVLAKAQAEWTKLAAAPREGKLPKLVNVSGPANIAVGGYDVVAFFTAKKATAGDPAIALEHAGATYFFSSEANKKAFEKAPEKYLPQYGGYCAVGMAFGALFPVEVDTWVVEDGKLYLNKSASVAQMFSQDRAGWLAKADAKWREMQAAAKDAK